MKTLDEKTENLNALAPYEELARAMNKSARRMACRDAVKHWHQAQSAAADIDQLHIVCLEQLRLTGVAICTAMGNEQMVFNLEGTEVVRRELLPLLDGMEMKQVKACVHIAQHLKGEVKTKEDLRVAKQELQLAFQALGLEEEPRRRELQQSHQRNWFAELVTRACGLRVLLEDIEKEEPMDHWGRERLEDFVFNNGPIALKVERAKALLAA